MAGIAVCKGFLEQPKVFQLMFEGFSLILADKCHPVLWVSCYFQIYLQIIFCLFNFCLVLLNFLHVQGKIMISQVVLDNEKTHSTNKYGLLWFKPYYKYKVLLKKHTFDEGFLFVFLRWFVGFVCSLSHVSSDPDRLRFPVSHPSHTCVLSYLSD